jgi:hypothetical protein
LDVTTEKNGFRFKKQKRLKQSCYLVQRQTILEPYSQRYIFLATYKLAQKARVLHKTRLERLADDKNTNLLVQFVSYEEKEVL